MGGHTFVTCLYALGLVELVFKLTWKWRDNLQMSETLRKVVLYGVGMVLLGEQCLEIYLVLLDRFHYTMDVLMAVLLALLWYTNSTLAIAAKTWYQYGNEPGTPLPDGGKVWVPFCCFPFCCLT